MYIRSVTNELRPTIRNAELKKYITKIHLVSEEDDNFEEKYYYRIFFKPDTVMNSYCCNMMDSTDCPVDLDINEWLKEIAEIKGE